MSMEALVSLFGSNPVAIAFPEASSPSLLDLKHHLHGLYQIPIEDQRIQTAGGLPLSTGDDRDDGQVLLFEDMQRIRCFGLSMRLGGGKGGFGSMLRAQGGRMSSQKSTNTDACRDLSGRRIKTVNDAKKIAEYVQTEPEREKARKENLKRKIDEKLELADRPTRKHRFEDSKFFDESEEQVEEVKSAVAAAIKESIKSGAASAASAKAAASGKGKGKAAEAAEKTSKKSPVKSLGMWDAMSDYESSEDEEDEEEEEEEAKVPSVGSSSSSSTPTKTSAAKGKGKGKGK